MPASPAATKHKTEGSGTGNTTPSNAKPKGWLTAEEKVVINPSGVNSMILLLPESAANRLPEASNASPSQRDEPEANALGDPVDVNLVMPPPTCDINKSPALLNANPSG